MSAGSARESTAGARIKRRLVLGLIAGTIIGAVLVAAEIVSYAALRISTYRSDEPHLEAPYVGREWAEAYWREAKASRTIEYESYEVWRRKPFAGQTINIDGNGVRRTHHTDCRPGSYTVFFFGGSTAWGSGAPDWETIPSFLAARYQTAGRPACVINFGESGWVATQEVVKLMLELKHNPRKPDLVVFYDGANDVYVPYQSGRFDVHQNYEQLRPIFDRSEARRQGGFAYLADTNLYRLARRAAEKLMARQINTARYARNVTDVEGVAKTAVGAYLKNVEIVEALSRQYRFEYAFFWQPILIVGGKPLTPDEADIKQAYTAQSPGLEELYASTYRRMQAESRARVHYIADVFANTPDTLYLDWAHLLPEGNRLVADRMFPQLESFAVGAAKSN